MSEDFFKTEKVLLTGGNEFALTTDYLYAGWLDKDGNKKLVMSNWFDKFSQFYYTSQFKSGEKELDFAVMESESDAIFLYVKNDGVDDRGNLYMSDTHGKQFTLSLKDIIRQRNGMPDIEEIKSLEGVLLANYEVEGPK